jgi:hypothetical protein
MKELAEKWREVLDAYAHLKDKHEVFCKEAVGADLDMAGPGLREALQRLFHKRRFAIFLEDLVYEEHRKGGISQLVPPVLQEADEPVEDEGKVPSNFKGKKSVE